MADYHTLYKGPEGESTQWEDIHRRLGNLPPKAPKWKPDPYKPEQEEVKDRQWVDKKDAGELVELEDEFADDQFLEEYRLQRIKELEAAAARPRFGTLEEISSNEFVQKVTDASNQYWVVCFLYKSSHAGCQLLEACLVELAKQYPSTRFIKIISTSCIPNYPDQNLPTLLLYHDGGCVKHLVGLGLFGGRHATPEQVALVLNTHGRVCSSGGDDDEEDGTGGSSSQQQQIKGLVERLVAQREAEREEADISSDFD